MKSLCVCFLFFGKTSYRVLVFPSWIVLQKRSMQCWSLSTGAEQFNFGSRIDHILCAGPCLHQEHDLQGHDSLSCHVKECDILTEYKRWKLGDTSRYHSIQLYLECGNAMEPLSFLCCLNLSMLCACLYIYIYMLACSCVYQWVCLHAANTIAFFTWLHRWKGGWGIRLEGSDHAPVYTSLEEIHDIPTHSTLPLSARYLSANDSWFPANSWYDNCVLDYCFYLCARYHPPPFFLVFLWEFYYYIFSSFNFVHVLISSP
jgi:hypothetical protein